MKTFKTIFRKEFTDTIRDRRTLFMMVLFPLLLMPLLLTVITRIQSASIKKASEKTMRIAFVSQGDARGFLDETKSRGDIKLIEGVPADSVESFIMHDSLDAAIVVAPGFDTTVAQLHAGSITFFYRSSDDYDIVKRRILTLLEGYEKKLVAARLARLHLDASISDAVRIDEHDVASMKERVGKAIGGMIPYLFVIFCFMGSMYPAIDLAAGEKERGTMETLLTAPVTRFQILLGKFAVVVAAGILSALVSLLGIVVALRQVHDIPPEVVNAIMAVVDVQTVLLVLSLLLPLSMFFAAFLLSLSMFAKSYKEAQSLISPLMIVIILPALIGVMPGVRLDAVTALVPVLNVCLATKEIIAGTIKPMLLAEVYVTLIILAAVSLFGCARWFEREETIFRGV
jgi:sodium transport system permease protein